MNKYSLIDFTAEDSSGYYGSAKSFREEFELACKLETLRLLTRYYRELDRKHQGGRS